MQDPSLMNPDYEKGFILYIFASNTSYVSIITKKNEEGEELPIDFMSLGLHNAELKYHEVDKNAFAMFKVLKHFRPYLLKSRTKVILPYPMVRNLLVQK